MTRIGRIVSGLVVAAAVAGAGACESAGPATKPSPHSQHLSSGTTTRRTAPSGADLEAIRAATAKYHNIDAAFADGYIDDGFGCIDAAAFGLDPSEGGMGFHLINWRLHDDPATDRMRPDLLVYEPANGNGKARLVALEYEVFRPDWWAAGNTAPPSLLGQEFESFDFDGLQIFGLHVWLWRDNPKGIFSSFNPKISCHSGK